jgi:hypothetical protein
VIPVVIMIVVVVVILSLVVTPLTAAAIPLLRDDDRAVRPLSRASGSSLSSARRPQENRHSQEERSDCGHP